MANSLPLVHRLMNDIAPQLIESLKTTANIAATTVTTKTTTITKITITAKTATTIITTTTSSGSTAWPGRGCRAIARCTPT